MTHHAPIVVDASAVVATLLGEDHSKEAASHIASATPIFAPDLITCEIVSAIFKRMRQGALTPDEAQLKREESSLLGLTLTPGRQLDERALALAQLMDHSVYDCFYLALAIDKSCPVLTADRRFAQAARRAGLDEYILLLGDT